MLSKYIENVYITSESMFSALFLKLNSQHIGFFFTSIFFAFLIYLYRKKSVKKVIKNVMRYFKSQRFCLELYKDIKFIPVRIVTKALIAITIGLSATSLSGHMKDLSDFVLGINWVRIPLDSDFGPVFKIIIVIIILDLGEFLSHLAGHKIENLWFFHKLHHRATALNSLTKVRMHPLEDYWGGVVRLVVATPLLYIFNKSYSIPHVPYYLWLQLAIIGSFYFFLNHLRHSHIRIHYPRFLSYVLISPVMHQVHHSNNPKHYDKNFGVIFSFWDLMLGTLYIPKKNEYFKFGLQESRNQIMGVWQEVYQPFIDLYNKYFQTDTKLSREYKKIFKINP